MSMMSVRHLSVRRAHQIGGASLLLAGTTILMGIITAEALRPPGYSTSRNEISDLGVAIQPSATLFNVIMGISSILILVGAYGVYRAYHSRAVSIPVALLGIGVLGVALFPGYPDSKVHVWVALLAFVAGGLAAMLAVRITAAPFRFISLVFGTIALVSLVLDETRVLRAPLGLGGAERWIVYPTVLWLIAFGGYILGHQPDKESTAQRFATDTIETTEPKESKEPQQPVAAAGSRHDA
ncbi:MAG TPA: DUF998 domain-containing protein [Ktedonobacterales bacterium]